MLDMLHSYMSVVYIYYYRGVFKNYIKIYKTEYITSVMTVTF